MWLLRSYISQVHLRGNSKIVVDSLIDDMGCTKNGNTLNSSTLFHTKLLPFQQFVWSSNVHNATAISKTKWNSLIMICVCLYQKITRLDETVHRHSVFFNFLGKCHGTRRTTEMWLTYKERKMKSFYLHILWNKYIKLVFIVHPNTYFNILGQCGMYLRCIKYTRNNNQCVPCY